MDFERPNRKQAQSVSTQVTKDSDNFFKTQGYHTCWTNDDKETKQQPPTTGKEAIQEDDQTDKDTLQL